MTQSRMFVVPDLAVEDVKVSQPGFTGLPSMTSVVALGTAVALKLSALLGLAPEAIQCRGVALAISDYALRLGFAKGLNPAKAQPEPQALPERHALLNASFVMHFEGANEQADSLLAGMDLREELLEALSGLRFSGGRFRIPLDYSLPNFEAEALRLRFPSARERALRLLPGHARLVVHRPDLVADMREAALPLMEGLAASTLEPERRPAMWQQFFEDPQRFADQALLRPVLCGYLYLEDAPSQPGYRPDVYGQLGPSRVASPLFSLAQLQSVRSVKAQLQRWLSGSAQEGLEPAFMWQQSCTDAAVVCHARADF